MTRYHRTDFHKSRYLGYKGVLILHPELDREKKHLVQFRHSMKKFSEGTNNTFTVVEYSKPYGFGRLNNDIIVLLSSLGVTDDKLLKKQQEYHQWITEASHDVPRAVDFLSCIGQYTLAERVFLEGMDDPGVLSQVRGAQRGVVASFRKNDKPRAPIMVHKSRLLFGVCDPFRVLREGEVFIRITVGRLGESSVIHGDVLVVRNPCLYPGEQFLAMIIPVAFTDGFTGDCLKLRAVHHNRLSHLIDCVVFATVAKPGRQSAPSMSSGGDLDGECSHISIQANSLMKSIFRAGDKFFVCWDPDLVPSKVAEPYDYPPNKERVSTKVTRADLANHFASYNKCVTACTCHLTPLNQPFIVPVLLRLLNCIASGCDVVRMELSRLNARNSMLCIRNLWMVPVSRFLTGCAHRQNRRNPTSSTHWPDLPPSSWNLSTRQR